MTPSQTELIATEFWYRIDEEVEPAQLTVGAPRALDDSSGYSCVIRWTLGGEQQQRKAFGADKWQAVLTGLCMLYWEVESLQRDRQAQLYWTDADAEQPADSVEVSRLFGGLPPGPRMSQRANEALATMSQFESVWNDALNWLDDSTEQDFQDLSASFAWLLEEVVAPSRLWESGRWFDSVLIGGAKRDDEILELVGSAIWGVGRSTAQFVSPVHLKFAKPTSKATFEWHVLLSNPDPPEPYLSAQEVYDYRSPEPNWHLEIFHQEEGRLWEKD